MSSEDPQITQEDEYESSADEDFNPESAEARQADQISSSDDDDDAKTHNLTKRPLRGSTGQQDELDFENSGDEATIQSGRRKKRKRGTAVADEDEGGEGGLVKTRAQRRAEKTEKGPVTDSSKASVDVDALWTQMSGSAASSNRNGTTNETLLDISSKTHGNGLDVGDERHNQADEAKSTGKETAASSPPSGGYNESMVTIKRKIEFAGQISEEERQVPASSAEAKLHLEQMNKPEKTTGAPKPGLRRPTKRKAAFDQIPPSDVSSKKLTTLEKSKLDWAAHVDQEGIADELNEHSKGKTDYLGRMDFLSRTNARREGS